MMESYWYGSSHRYATTERTIAGEVVVFRSLAAHEVLAADLTAQEIATGDAGLIARAVQHLAQSIVSIGGVVLPEIDPEAGLGDDDEAKARHDAAMSARIGMLHRWPGTLLGAVYTAWQGVQGTFVAMAQPGTGKEGN